MAEVPPYVTSTATAPIRLDRNESPAEMTLEVKEKVLVSLAAARWSRYPDPYAGELKAALAAREGLPAESVIVGNGSNSLLLSFFLAAAVPSRKIGLCPPTFGLYSSWARAAGYVIENFPLADGDLAPPLETMLLAARKDSELAFVICSPNNPTGTLFPADGVIALLETGALVVLDEAYVEFSGGGARGLLSRFANLLISRTLSKAAALAGVRVGYMLGDPLLLEEIEKVVPPFSVNVFARAAALAALAEPEALRERVVAVIAERHRLEQALAAMPGARLADSQANFLYLRPVRPAEELFRELLDRGILVRRVPGTREGALRVTVGRPEENDRFLEAWREVTR